VFKKTESCTWTDYTTNTGIAKGLNTCKTPLLYKMQKYRRTWIRHVKRIPHITLPRTIKKLQTKRQKEPGETIEETVACVRPERVSKWPIYMTASLLLLSLLLLLLLTSSLVTGLFFLVHVLLLNQR
jgi:hypothetical protein